MPSWKESIIQSIQPILSKPRFVFIDSEKVRQVAQKLMPIKPPGFDFGIHYYSNDIEKVLYYLFFLDSINFCFWGRWKKEQWSIETDGKPRMSGYCAFAYAIKRLFQYNPDYFNSAKLASIDYNNFQWIFYNPSLSTQGFLELVPARNQIIKHNFEILHRTYGGSVTQLLKRTGFDCQKLVTALIDNFPSFTDYREFNHTHCFFLKRAQLLAADIHSALRACQYPGLTNADQLTVLADYRLPQILEFWGVLKYTPKLKETIKSKRLIGEWTHQEIEIRASTVYVGEMIRMEMEKMGRKISSFELDSILWRLSHEEEVNTQHHRTLTINY